MPRAVDKHYIPQQTVYSDSNECNKHTMNWKARVSVTMVKISMYAGHGYIPAPYEVSYCLLLTSGS